MKKKKEKPTEIFYEISVIKFKDGEIYAGWCDNPVFRGDVIRWGYRKNKETNYWQMNIREAIAFQRALADTIQDYLFAKKKV